VTDAPRPDAHVPLIATSGRQKAAEPTDPFIAVAVSVPTPGYDGMAAMARTFVEEFALMGWSREHIARMFSRPNFVGPYAVYRARGPEFVESLIDDVFGGPEPDRVQAEES
jgi:hypothetical protein